MIYRVKFLDFKNRVRRGVLFNFIFDIYYLVIVLINKSNFLWYMRYTLLFMVLIGDKLFNIVVVKIVYRKYDIDYNVK